MTAYIKTEDTGLFQTTFLHLHQISIVHVKNLVAQPARPIHPRIHVRDRLGVQRYCPAQPTLPRPDHQNHVASNVSDEPDKPADFPAVSSGKVPDLQDVLESLIDDDLLCKTLLVLKNELINAQLQSKLAWDVDSKIAKWHQVVL